MLALPKDVSRARRPGSSAPCPADGHEHSCSGVTSPEHLHFLEAHLALIDLHRQARAFDHALAVAQHLVTTQPNNARAHLALGETYWEKMEIPKALAAFQTAIAKAPQDPGGHYLLGLAYREQQQDQEALAAFEHALALNPHLSDALSQVQGHSVFDVLSCHVEAPPSP